MIMPVYNLIEYSDNYSKTSGSLWQHCKEIPAVNNAGNIVDSKVPLKCLSDFWRTLEMPLINCEVKLILTGSAGCVIIYADVANQVPTFTITETNLYVPAITLSTEDNAKLLPQLKSGFERTISWNKYLSKPELLAQNEDLNHLIKPSFQVVNRLFVLAFKHHNIMNKE